MRHWNYPRSILFAPADRPEVAIKAFNSSADAVCLDLEDGVAPQKKQLARKNLQELVHQANKTNKPAWIRINSDLIHAARDIESLVEGVEYIVLPKTLGWSQIVMVEDALQTKFASLSANKETAPARPGLIAMLEDLASIDHFLHSSAPVARQTQIQLQSQTQSQTQAQTQAETQTGIQARGQAGFQTGIQARIQAETSAAHATLVALALGTEDLANDLGVKPNDTFLNMALYDLVKLGRKLDLPVIGFPGSIANYSDLAKLADTITTACQLGVRGGFCIHPNQIPILNELYSPTVAEISWAEGVLDFSDQVAYEGVAVHPDTGQMIDRPILMQAWTVIKRSKR